MNQFPLAMGAVKGRVPPNVRRTVLHHLIAAAAFLPEPGSGGIQPPESLATYSVDTLTKTSETLQDSPE